MIPSNKLCKEEEVQNLEILCFICFGESTKNNQVIQLHDECTLTTHLSCLKEYMTFLKQKNIHCPQCSRYIVFEASNKDIVYDIEKMTIYHYFKGYYLLFKLFKDEEITFEYRSFETRYEHYLLLFINYILYTETFVILFLNNEQNFLNLFLYLYNSGMVYYLLSKLHNIRMDKTLHIEQMKVDFQISIQKMGGLFFIFQPLITFFIYFIFFDIIYLYPISHHVISMWILSSVFIIYCYFFGTLKKRN